MIASQPLSLKPIADADAPVLLNAPLKSGYDRNDLSRYSDDFWDLGPAVFIESARRCHTTIKFESVDNFQVREALRAYLFVRLNIRVRAGPPLLPPANVRQAFNKSRRFFEFVVAAVGRLDMASVDQSLLDRYVKETVSGRTRSPAYNVQLLIVLRDLYEFRDHFPNIAIHFEPFEGRSLSSVVGYKSRTGENATPRIPEPVIFALIHWSLKYVRLYANDIFAARSEISALEQKRDRLLKADKSRSREKRRRLQWQRVERFLKTRAEQGRGVPLWGAPHSGVIRIDPNTKQETPPFNWYLLHLHAGVNGRATPKDAMGLGGGTRKLEHFVRAYGTERGGLDTEISQDPDLDAPWRPRLDVRSLRFEENMLQTACYVLCAYLTGMRDCEVQAMRSGCLSVHKTEDGLIDRYRVRSTAHKYKASGGEPADWVTIEPVAAAIEVLERLAAPVSRPEAPDTLWPVLHQKSVTKAFVSAEIVRSLNRFVSHINDTLCKGDADRGIPTCDDGKPWHLATRQFRRTIAWHIANRPFGTIAGMIQYKHASVAAFEGYAGESRSGFRRQVDQERRLGQIDDILTYFDEHQLGTRFSGPAARRVVDALDRAGSGLEPLPGKIADRRRLANMLKNLAKTLHVGVLADCFFEPSTAMCLKTASSTDQTGPHTALCQPTKCPNACIKARHLPAWRSARDHAREHLKQKRLPKLQRQILNDEVERIENVINDVIDS